MRPQTKKIGPLDVIEIPGSGKGPTMVVLHGYGADFTDLVSLANVIRVPHGTRWLFPNGLIEVELGPHSTGRAWFQIDVEALLQAQLSGTHRDLSKSTPPGLKQARIALSEMLVAAGLKVSDVVLMGFSQGAMLATMATLYSDENPKGLVIFSGALLDESQWKARAPKHKGLRFFQSHGDVDPILHISGGEKLNAALTEGGMIGNLQVFHGGHELPQEVLSGASDYLKKQLI